MGGIEKARRQRTARTERQEGGGHEGREDTSPPPTTEGAEDGEAVPRTPCTIGQISIFLRYLRLGSVLLVGICFLQPIGNWHGTRPVPNLPNLLNRSGIVRRELEQGQAPLKTILLILGLT